jgi:hypothetical protein
VSTEFMKMEFFLKSTAQVRVIMLRAALAILVWGWFYCLPCR